MSLLLHHTSLQNNEHDSSIEVEDLKSATTTSSSSSFAFDSPPVNVMKLIKPKVRIQPRKPGASPFTSTYNKFAIRTTAAGSGFGRVNTSLNAGGSGKDHISPTTLAKLKSFDAACNGHRSVSVMKDSASASSTTGRRHGGFTVQRDKPNVSAASGANAASTRVPPHPLPSMKVAEKRKAGTGGKLMKMLEME